MCSIDPDGRLHRFLFLAGWHGVYIQQSKSRYHDDRRRGGYATHYDATNAGPMAGRSQPGTVPIPDHGDQRGPIARETASETATGTLVISGVAATTLSVASATGTYGDTANLSATLTSAASGVPGKIVSFSINGNSVGTATTNSNGVAALADASLAGLNAGDYQNGIAASFAGDSSHAAANGISLLTVSKASATVSVTGYTGTYDGDAHGATGSATGVKGEDLSGLLDLGDGVTDVPGGTVAWTFAGNTNYAATSGSVAITLSQAAATVSVIGYTGTYDGDAHGATGERDRGEGEDLSSLLTIWATG